MARRDRLVVTLGSNLAISLIRNHPAQHPHHRAADDHRLAGDRHRPDPQGLLFDISKQLSVFVGLIITNCIVMGRAEAYAMQKRPCESFIDGIGNGLGYSLVLIIVAFFRELLGAGKLFGVQVLPLPSPRRLVRAQRPDGARTPAPSSSSGLHLDRSAPGSPSRWRRSRPWSTICSASPPRRSSSRTWRWPSSSACARSSPVSKKVETAIGLGFAVTFVLAVTVPLNNLI
jgi:hypothetical protein